MVPGVPAGTVLDTASGTVVVVAGGTDVVAPGRVELVDVVVTTGFKPCFG